VLVSRPLCARALAHSLEGTLILVWHIRGDVWVCSYDGSDICFNTGESLFQRGGTAMTIERLANLSDEVQKARAVLRW